MGQKRQFEYELASAKKRHRGNDYEGASYPKKHAGRADSSGWAKKRARAIERRMKHGPEGLPANVQQDLERELAMLRRQLDTRQAKRQRAHMISKYHMIRFFERKKAIRLEKQLRRRLAATDDAAEKAALEADLHIAEVDKMYAIYFPFMEPYVSLYPAEGKKKQDKDENENENENEKGSKASQLLHAPRPALWTVVEAAMRDGGVAALERLQERQPDRDETDESAEPAEPAEPAGKTASKARKAREAREAQKAQKAPAQTVEDDSDGGFFE